MKYTNNNQITSLEQVSNDQRKQIAKLESKVTELEAEVHRLTTTNDDLSEKIVHQKDKLKERGDIIKEQ